MTLKKAKEVLDIAKAQIFIKEKVDHIIVAIGKKILEEAQAGNLEVKISAGAVEEYIYRFENYSPTSILFYYSNKDIFTTSNPISDSEFEIIKKMLIESGYSVSFVGTGDTYVPRGLASDFDPESGPRYRNVSMIISWKDAK